ncbi:unnamed protein product [Brassica oleracea]
MVVIFLPFLTLSIFNSLRNLNQLAARKSSVCLT